MTNMMRAAALTFAGVITALPASAFDISTMTAPEKEAFGAEVRSYLLENPQVLREVIAALEEQESAQQAMDDIELVKSNQVDLFDDGYSWVGGNPDGDITIVEFVDYRCGYCRKAFPEVEELVSTDGNIRLIMKEFPILGEQSLISSRFAIAVLNVAGNDAYKQAHDALIQMRVEANEQSLAELAQKLGLDPVEILAKMDSVEVNQTIAANHALGKRMEISGTPTFIVETELLRGYLPLDNMRGLVEQLRADG